MLVLSICIIANSGQLRIQFYIGAPDGMLISAGILPNHDSPRYAGPSSRVKDNIPPYDAYVNLNPNEVCMYCFSS